MLYNSNILIVLPFLFTNTLSAIPATCNNLTHAFLPALTTCSFSTLGIWEPYCVKTQTLKTAIESACLILRIDDVVSGTRKKKNTGEGN